MNAIKLSLVCAGLVLGVSGVGAGDSPHNAEDWYAQAFEQTLKGHLAEAVTSYQQALELRPDYAEAHHALATLYYQMKDGVRAVHHLRQAEKLYQQRGDPLSRKNLTIVRNNLEQTYARFDLEPREFEELEQLRPPPARETWRVSGAGFLLGDRGHVLTLLHPLEEAEGIRLRFSDGSVHPARRVRSFRVYNIAVLQIDDPESPFPSGLPLGDASAMEEGDPAYGLDFGSAPAGQGRIPQALKTRIAALKAVTRDKNMFELEPGFQPEHDGGPLLDRRGKVIGIVLSVPRAMEAFQATGRAPGGRIVLKASYLRRVLSNVPGLAKEIDRGPTHNPKPTPASREEGESPPFPGSALVLIETTK